MPLRRALISVFTLFGGHFLNRRLDRVVLIATLLVAPVIALIGVPYALFFTGHSEVGIITWAFRMPLILLGALLLLSAVLTFRDAQRPLGQPLTVAMRVSGATLSLVGALLLTSALVASASRFTPTRETEVRTESIGPATVYQPFHGYVSFGVGVDTLDLPAPPSGPERLRGRITLDGAGVKGVQLYLVLNGKYKVEHLRSDSRGVFEVALPAGKWNINSVAVSEWDGKPQGRDLVLYSGHEPVRGSGQYSRFSVFAGSGLEVSLPLASNALPLELELRDALPLTWPPRLDSFDVRAGRTAVPDAALSTGAITWQPVKAAAEYEVQISHVTREGTTTQFRPILMRRLPGLTLPLASLPQRSPSSAAADEYTVHIYAFDKEGKLLTESGTDYNEGMFKLAGGARLGKERQIFGSSSPEVISAEYEMNDLRLSLAAKLLEQKQLDEARRVLDQVTKDAPHGRAPALRGRLFALQGDCVTATRLFDRADAEGGPGCAPIEDRKLCGAPPQ